MVLKHMNSDSAQLIKIKTTGSYNNITPVRLDKFQQLNNTLGETMGKQAPPRTMVYLRYARWRGRELRIDDKITYVPILGLSNPSSRNPP